MKLHKIYNYNDSITLLAPDEDSPSLGVQQRGADFATLVQEAGMKILCFAALCSTICLERPFVIENGH